MSEIGESDTNEEESPESPEVNQTNLFEVRDKELKAGGKVSIGKICEAITDVIITS